MSHPVKRGTGRNPLMKQMGTALWGTTEVATETDEINLLFHEFATNLIHRPIGEGEQQPVTVSIEQFFLQNTEHTKRGFTRTRRSNDQEEIT